MPTTRLSHISLEDSPWYYCVSSCVRSAWICGFDEPTARVPYYLLDYIEFAECTDLAVRDDKHGKIDGSIPPLLERLGLDPLD